MKGKTGGDMSDQERLSKDACDERHKNIDKILENIDKNISIIYTRLNWFYVTTISALITTLLGVLIAFIKK